MKHLTMILGTLLFAMLAVNVTAQESDSDLVKRYIEAYDQLKLEIQQVSRSAQLNEFEDELISLLDEFQDNEAMINYAIYPQDFATLNEELFSQIQLLETQLLIIENQRERLLDLTNQVASYRSEINKLNIKADSLRKSIVASEANEARLSELISDYRRNMERRDALVFDMIDSLLIRYDNLAEMSNGFSHSEIIQQRISTEENPLALVSTILRDHLEFTKANNTYASVEDHLRMYALQSHFNQTWNKIGSKMINVYGGTSKAEWEMDIEQSLKEWRMISSSKMWKSIDQYLEFNNIDLNAFDNTESFFTALDSYLTDGLSLSEKEILTSDSYLQYITINDFWNSNIKNEWRNAELLTTAQISQIDVKLVDWEKIARPIHPALIVLVSLLLVSLSGFILVVIKARASKAY